jgi:hypothetical protein
MVFSNDPLFSDIMSAPRILQRPPPVILPMYRLRAYGI